MARKRVEETMSEGLENQPVNVETTYNSPMQNNQTSVEQVEDEPYSCLRNEIIRVQFVPSPNAMVQSKDHILYGGMADNAKREYVVPRLQSSGVYKNVLTTNEKNFLEQVLGLAPNALSVHKRGKDSFWSDANPNGIGKVILYKQGNSLDLSNPIDYIKYKILLANSDYIAPSLRELEENPKATYQFVLVSENAETQRNLSKIDAIKRCYMEYGKIETDTDVMRYVVEVFEGRPISAQTKLDYLQGKINEYIQQAPRRFLDVIQDELLPAKVLIRKANEAGIIGKKNDTYYLTEDGRPLCEMNEESTLNVAAKYISSVKRTELKYSIEAKLKSK